MSFHQDGFRITLTSEVDEGRLPQIVLVLGLSAEIAFDLGPRIGWSFVEFINDLLAGSPHFDPYPIPEDRSTPFRPKYMGLVCGHCGRTLTAEEAETHKCG